MSKESDDAEKRMEKTYDDIAKGYYDALPSQLNIKQKDLVNERTKLVLRSLIEPTRQLMDEIKALSEQLGLGD